MAPAFGRAAKFVNEVVDLFDVRPDECTIIDVCDCRLDIQVNPPAFPFVVYTKHIGGCILFGTGKQCISAHKLIYQFCNANDIVLYFDCLFWGVSEDYKAMLRNQFNI